MLSSTTCMFMLMQEHMREEQGTTMQGSLQQHTLAQLSRAQLISTLMALANREPDVLSIVENHS